MVQSNSTVLGSIAFEHALPVAERGMDMHEQYSSARVDAKTSNVTVVSSFNMLPSPCPFTPARCFEWRLTLVHVTSQPSPGCGILS